MFFTPQSLNTLENIYKHCKPAPSNCWSMTSAMSSRIASPHPFLASAQETTSPADGCKQVVFHYKRKSKHQTFQNKFETSEFDATCKPYSGYSKIEVSEVDATMQNPVALQCTFFLKATLHCLSLSRGTPGTFCYILQLLRAAILFTKLTFPSRVIKPHYIVTI